MSYMHIDNLYKAQEILSFRACYALEKIHGTSAHVAWKDGQVRLSSGGVKHEAFAKLFDVNMLAELFASMFLPTENVTVYGEAYGGSCQRMGKTYGPALKFVAFEVKVGDVWLAVPQAANVAYQLGLEFVDWAEVPTELDALDAERDKPSVQAIRNGMGDGHIREGVVLRPPFEVVMNNSKRVMAKHKREEFAERGNPKVELDPSKRQLMEDAAAIATEWVTPNRLEHVVDQVKAAKADKDISIKDTGAVIAVMTADIAREAAGEIVDNAAVRRAIGGAAVTMFKKWLAQQLEGQWTQIA